MGVSILTLVENTAQGEGILAEHGISWLIETPGARVLMDAGQGLALLANADKLGAALSNLTAVVLSHGHFDHTGGLMRVLEQVKRVPVVAHPAALSPKFAVRKGKKREIGIPFSREALEAAGAILRLDEGPQEVVEGVLATGEVPRVTDFESVSEMFQVPAGDGLVHDLIPDDQSLIVDTDEGPVLVLGCAHAGLINTLMHASSLTGARRFAAVIGGTHMVEADDARIQRTIQELGQFDIGWMGPCHCTGFKGQAAFYQAMGKRFVQVRAGDRFIFGES
jgi:7,8-dihydropterin-6-yl-methyl-4-(beta-D-ribofuranosyl)aminobenzene 5'-phosphate synthase